MDDIYAMIYHVAATQLSAMLRALQDAASDPASVADVDTVTIQRLLTTATRLYAAKREAGEAMSAFEYGADLPSATDVAVTVSAMLEDAGIELFELGLWQTWGTPKAGDSATV